MEKILKEKGFIHSLRAFEDKKESVDKIFSQSNYKVCLDNSISTLKKILNISFYPQIENEMALLAEEFYHIDNML